MRITRTVVATGVAVICGAVGAFLALQTRAPNSPLTAKESMPETVAADPTPPAHAAAETLSPPTRTLEEAIPVSDLQVARVQNIKGESIAQVMDHLANFDDFNFASTADGAHSFSPDEAYSVSHAIPRLYRVRKIIEMAQEQREGTLTRLRITLQRALEGWPEAYAAEKKLWKDHPTGFTKTEPSRHDILQAQSQAGTYALAELEDCASLPLLVSSLTTQQRWVDQDTYFCISQCPVPPPLTLYAIHKLIVAYPEAELGDAAKKSRKLYLKWAAEHVPAALVFQGVSSTSLRDESEPLIQLFDPQQKLTEKEPKLLLSEFPVKFRDGTPIQKYDEAAYLTPQAEEWVRLILDFAGSMPK